MKFKSISTDKTGVEFCYNGISVRVSLSGNEIRIAEEITYEVSTGSVLSNMKIVLREGKAYLTSPFGENEIREPGNIVKGLRELSELIKTKSPELHQQINAVLYSFASQ